jgi:hypothetical protein
VIATSNNKCNIVEVINLLSVNIVSTTVADNTSINASISINFCGVQKEWLAKRGNIVYTWKSVVDFLCYKKVAVAK